MELPACPYRHSWVEGGKSYEGCEVSDLSEKLADKSVVPLGDGFGFTKGIGFLCKHCKLPTFYTDNPCIHLNVGISATVEGKLLHLSAHRVKNPAACELTHKKVKPMLCFRQCPNFASEEQQRQEQVPQPTTIPTQQPMPTVALICPACGSNNNAGTRFCGNCGSNLTAPGPQPSQQMQPSVPQQVQMPPAAQPMQQQPPPQQVAPGQSPAAQPVQQPPVAQPMQQPPGNEPPPRR